MAFDKPKASSTARGLGTSHTKRVAAMPVPEGDPCPLCRLPMWPGKRRTKSGRMVSVLEADHVTPRALGGGDGPLRWTHAWCNRSSGARLGAQITNARRKVTRVQPQASRPWGRTP